MNDNGKRTEGTGRKPGGMVLLRAAAGCYLAYLGYMLLRTYGQGTTPIRPWLAWVAGLLFIAAGIGFAWYSWRRYRAETKSAGESSEEDRDPS